MNKSREECSWARVRIFRNMNSSKRRLIAQRRKQVWSRVVFSEHGLKSLRGHFVEEALDGSACCLGRDGDLVRLDVNRCLRRYRRGRWCLGPRLEVDVWDRAAGHSLVRALAVEVVDVVDVHRSILMSVHITTTISIIYDSLSSSSAAAAASAALPIHRERWIQTCHCSPPQPWQFLRNFYDFLYLLKTAGEWGINRLQLHA